MCWINLQLFGGRGGGSGMGGGEMDGFQALASGVLEDDLTQKQSDQVLEYLQDFLRGAQKLKGN